MCRLHKGSMQGLMFDKVDLTRCPAPARLPPPLFWTPSFKLRGEGRSTNALSSQHATVCPHRPNVRDARRGHHASAFPCAVTRRPARLSLPTRALGMATLDRALLPCSVHSNVPSPSLPWQLYQHLQLNPCKPHADVPVGQHRTLTCCNLPLTLYRARLFRPSTRQRTDLTIGSFHSHIDGPQQPLTCPYNDD